MTESEWLQSADPHAMISYLQEERTHFRTRWQGWMTVRRFRVSERKWRLFYCAVVRRIAHLMPADACRELLGVAEQYADSLASKEEMQEAIAASTEVWAGELTPWTNSDALNAIGRFHRSEEEGRIDTLLSAARAWATGVCIGQVPGPAASPAPAGQTDWIQEQAAEAVRQASLLREVIGNPFHAAVADPMWLAWQDGTIPRMAKTICEEQRFASLPVLADALEDAGCCDEAILAHCRAESSHVRGCWLLDLLLARE